ncbi:MAG: phosphotransferase [Eubacterium sp.]|nr:phosphotransferase [Eubacterium sp.]
MQTKEERGVLTVALPERVDGSNSDEFEKELRESIGASEFRSLAMDAGGMEYISSAGLRVLLAIKKEIGKPFDIINVSEEVYEIFDVTGFTELFTVHRKPREISIEGCPVIGRGTFGTVYKLDDERVVKVYNTARKVSLERIEQEKRLARDVFVKGIPTAMSFNIVYTGEHYGLVFEMLNASSLLDYMMEHRDEADEMTDKVCQILKKLHSSELPEGSVPSMKQILLSMTPVVKNHFTEDEMNRFRTLITDTPDRMTMIHGDFHPGNIMVDKNRELMLIDVGDISTGHPFFEFFDMYPSFLLNEEVEYGHDAVMDQIRLFLHIGPDKDVNEGIVFMKQYWNRMMHAYFDGFSEDEIEKFSLYFRAMGRFKQFITVMRLPDTDPEAKEREIQKNKKLFFDELDKIPPVAEWWPEKL